MQSSRFPFHLYLKKELALSVFLRIDVQGAILAAFPLRGLNLFTPTSNKRNLNLTHLE